MLGVTFGSKHSYNDWGIWLEDTHINPPLPKRYIVDVPARNGLLDLTPELTPTIRFENRTLTFNFRVKAGDWSSLVSTIYGDVHGKTLDVVSDLDPNWHWHGCVTVDDFSSDERTGKLVITVDADPFKLSNTENSYTVNGDGTITCEVDRMEISPAFEIEAPTTVIYGDSSYTIESTATTEKTLSGDIVSFADGTANPAVDLTLDIDATQDLHGYDAPWVGGAGKNLFQKTDYRGAYNASAGTDLATGTANANYTMQNDGANFNFTASWQGRLFVTAPLTTGDYTISMSAGSAIVRATLYVTDSDLKVVTNIRNYQSAGAYAPTTVTITSGQRIAFYASANTTGSCLMAFQVESGSSATTYERFENICPISGWDEVNVCVAGKNLFFMENWNLINGYFTLEDGIRKIIANASHYIYYFPCEPNTTYTVSKISGGENIRLGIAYSTEKPAVGSVLDAMYTNNGTKPSGTVVSVTATTSATAKYLAVWAYWVTDEATKSTIQLELGDSRTDFSSFANVYTTDLDGTRYGGTLDVTTGVLTIDKGYADLSEKTWTRRQAYTFSTSLEDSCNNAVPISEHFSDMFNVIYVAGYSGLNSDAIGIYHPSSPTGSTGTIYFRYSGIGEDSVSGLTAWFANNKPHLVYELATPQVVQLTAEQVMILKNQNNIWADSGEVEVTYIAQDYAGKKFYIPDLELTEGSNTLTIQGTGTTKVTYTNGRL